MRWHLTLTTLLVDTLYGLTIKTNILDWNFVPIVYRVFEKAYKDEKAQEVNT